MSKLRFFGSFVAGLFAATLLLLTLGNFRSNAEPRYQNLGLLSNVLHLVDQYYVKDVDEHDLVEGALKGMLDVLDPHTSYLSKDLYKELQLDTKGEFEGLGIEITKRDGYVTVVSPIDGTPAQRAGIKAGDQIIAVCPDLDETACTSTQELNLLEAVKLMRGPRGSEVMIQILREGWPAPKPYVIKRASIKVPSVVLHMVEPGLPYIRMSQFQERTAGDLHDKLKEARKSGELKGLVLDLRDNPGGLLDQSVRVADLFIKEGLIVFSEGREGENRMEWKAQKSGTEPEYPIVVLVNGGSASASEIVAGALQDHDRGLVMGTETFGKGSVQTIIPLDDGSGLRLTTALYYLPSGRSIQEVRIQPDLLVESFTELELTALQEREDGETFGEKNLEGHLKTGRAKPAEKVSDEFADRMVLDRQLSRAVELLKSWTVFSQLKIERAAE